MNLSTIILFSIIGIVLVGGGAYILANRRVAARPPDSSESRPPATRATKGVRQREAVDPHEPEPLLVVNSSPPKKPRYELVTIRGAADGSPKQGTRFVFTNDELTIGRELDNNVVIADSPLVSRYHAAILIEGETLVLTDLASGNGTWLNGQRIDGTALIQVDEPFQVGPCLFSIVPFGRQDDGETASNEKLSLTDKTYTREEILKLCRQLGVSIEGQLGSGGAATVYLCENENGAQLALKVLHRRVNAYFKQKFQDEIEVGRRLNHPNIINIIDGGYAHGSNIPYILMPFMERGSLGDYLHQAGRLSASEAAQLISQIAAGLQHAHDLNIYHRDIKPANILIDRSGKLKIADFGIAKLTERATLTRVGAILGTPEYMSYEQARGQSVDPRSDQYSVGIILYQMLTGRVPFLGAPFDIVRQHIDSIPPPFRQIAPTVADHLNSDSQDGIEEIVFRMLDKEKSARYPSMQAVEEALAPYLPEIEIELTTSGHRHSDALRAAVQKRWLQYEHEDGVVIDLTARLHELEGDEGLVLGRFDFDELPEHVSRKHALFYMSDGRLMIEDQGSSNGTFVNGEKISGPVMLRHGSYVTLGRLALRYFEASA